MKFETKMEIDLAKLKSNTNLLCKSYSDYKYKMVDLKDNGHGLGLKIVNTMADNGINYFTVGSLKDGINIRKFNKDVKILVNYYVSLDEIYDAINNNLTVTIYSLEHLKLILSLNVKDDLNVQILIDNGANLMGVSTSSELEDIINLIKENKHIKLEGFYTELTTLGVDDEHYYEEVNNFYKITKEYLSDEYLVHFNEPVMYHKKINYVNGIRFDLSILGIEENISDDFFTSMKIKGIEKKYNDLEFPDIDLKLIFNITSEVMQTKFVKKGSIIGKNYVAKENMYVALIPIGHKDGITKAVSYVGINNYKRDILVDEIDYIVVKADEGMQPKDRVYILNEERGIYDLLKLLNTNRYYLMSILNRNLQKEYLNEEFGDNLL